MTDAETRLRELFSYMRDEGYNATAAHAENALYALLAEHRREVSTVRDTVLAEAIRACGSHGYANAETFIVVLRALQSQPASVVPMARVREVLTAARRESPDMTEADEHDILRRLGVDLDATPEHGGPCRRKNDPRGCAPECRATMNAPGVGCIAAK